MLLPEHTYEIDYFFRTVLRLSNEDLIAELTDHFSASIEEQMDRGITFPESLHTIFSDFGGRKGLQQMERQYNSITFRQFDKVWKEAILSQFHTPNLWVTVAVYVGVFALSFFIEQPQGEKVTTFFEGFPTGMLMGGMVVSMNALLPYLKDRLVKGPHNPQSEAWYLFKRSGLFVSVFFGLGFLGSWSPFLVQPTLVALYFTLLFVYLRTQGIIYRHLYDVA